MNIEKMFIILVNIVLITLMLIQTNSTLGYFYTVIFAFVEIVLFLIILSKRKMPLENLYILLTVILGFLFLILYLLDRTGITTSAVGYLLIAAFFIGLVISSFTIRKSQPAIEVYDSNLERPKPPKENVFEEIEQKKEGKIKSELKKQALALLEAEKKLDKITRRLAKKPVKKKKGKKPVKKRSKKR